jgi:hypothetical protein
MRVLDIYENYCWSFQCENPVALRQLRVAATRPDPAVRDSELDSIGHSHAYRLVGDAAAFELAEDFFDEINVEYAPTVLKRTLLAQKTKRWLKPDGNLYLPETESEAPERRETFMPLRRPAFGTA